MKLLELFQSGAYKTKTESELMCILRRSLQNTMISALRGKTPIDRVPTRVDLEDASQLVGESGFADLYLNHLVDYLSHFVSVEAQVLLRNLVQPSEEVIHEELMKTLRRAHLRRQGVAISGSQKLTHNLVGSVLGFTESKTKALIRELQVAYCNHVVPLSGAPCPRLYYSLTQS